MHDVLIVLGYNTIQDDPVFQSRVNKAVELHNKGVAPQIIMSGCCSDKLDIKPKQSEAACMRDYAIDSGIASSVIMLEEESVDTLGNFYFTKKNILLACNWFNVGIVSTPWHVFRSEWLAEQVLGPEFEVTGYPSENPEGWGEKNIQTSEEYNRKLLDITQTQLAGVTPGDHESVFQFLGTAPRG